MTVLLLSPRAGADHRGRNARYPAEGISLTCREGGLWQTRFGAPEAADGGPELRQKSAERGEANGWNLGCTDQLPLLPLLISTNIVSCRAAVRGLSRGTSSPEENCISIRKMMSARRVYSVEANADPLHLRSTTLRVYFAGGHPATESSISCRNVRARSRDVCRTGADNGGLLRHLDPGRR